MNKKLLFIKSGLMFLGLLLCCNLSFAQTFAVVGTGTTSNSASSYPAPMGNYYYGSRHQMLVTAAELTAAGIAGGSLINSVGFNVTGLNASIPHQNWEVKVFTSSTPNPLAAGWVSTGQVASSTPITLTPVLGWMQTPLTTAFTWNGTDDLVIETCHNNTSFNDNVSTEWTTNLASTTTWTRWFRQDASGVCTNTSTTSTSTSTRPNMRFEWVGGTACSGQPNVATASGPASVCPSVAFTLTATGATTGSGISYSWEFFNTATSTWDPVTNATSSIASVSGGQTVATDYRFKTVCANGGGTDISNTVTVTMNPVTACYCTPIYTTACSVGDDIDDVILIGDVLPGINNLNTLCPPGGYQDFTATMSATLNAGYQYSGNVTTNYGSNSENVNIWIDYNLNGLFESTESIATLANISNASTGAFSFLVPSTTPAGSYRMRVRLVYSTNPTTMDPCISYTYGEAHDYMIHVVTPPACAGVPNIAVASGPASVCSGSAITLAATNYSIGTGLTYQWESFDAVTSTWVAVPNATTPSYTITTGQTSATDYRLLSHCANGGGQSVSNTVSVAMNSFYLCYCQPATGTTLHSTGLNYITNVTIASTTLNTSTTTVGAGGYTQHFPTTASNTTNLDQGIPYNISITHPYTGYFGGAWIDFDQNGTMDAAEFIPMTTTGTVSSGSFTIPYSATPGLTGLRVRMHWGAITSGQPCTNQGYETEDFVINIIQAVGCTGIPNMAVAAGPATICSGAPLSLTSTGFSTGMGMTYQWEAFDPITSAWIAVPNATTPNYTITTGQTAATDYRMVSHCANGGGQSVSNTVSVAMSSFYLCYCQPSTGTTLHSTGINYITNVTIASTTLNTSTTTVGTGGYTQHFPTTATNTANLDQGIQYSLSITHPYTGYFGGAWMDFDQSGTMDVAEFIPMTTTGTVSTGTFIIPYSATPGLTGLRVRMHWGAITSGQPCTNQGYETEDFVVNVIQAVGCSGIPNIAVVSGPANACAATPFTLTATGYSIGTGISYAWEFFNTTTSTWDPMPGTNTNPTYIVVNQTAATDYRFTTHCSNGGGTSVSNTLSVGQNLPTQCYCTPIYTTACSVGDDIDDVIFAGDVPPGINNLNTPCPANGYQDYTAMSAFVSPGLSYSGNVTTNYTGASENVNIWIDYNVNGVFEASESVATIANISNTSTGAFNFTVPATTPMGTYRMRVRLVFATTPATMDPCLSYTYGEAHDYTIHVSAPPTCLPPTSPSVVAGTGTTGSATWTPSTSAPANGYEWRVFAQGTGPNGTPVASGFTTTAVTSASISGLSPTLSYTFYVRAHCSATDSSNWNTANFTTPCATVTGPYTYDVESHTGSTTVMSNCWTSTPTGNATVYAWNVSTNGTTPSTGTGPTAAHSGTKFFFVESSYGTIPNTAELISPVIDITSLGTAQLEFWYHMFGTTMGNLETSIWNGTTWTVVDLLTGQQQATQASPWLQKTIPLQGYTGAIQVRFKAIHGGTFTGDIAIDDISFVQAPACLPPAGLSAINVTPTAADVLWTAATGVVNYEYAVDQTNTAAPGGSSTVTTTTSITPPTVTGLSGGNTYYLHVRTNCGTTNGYSAWAVYSFGTPPPNDPCLNAINISNQLSTPGVTIGATQSMPACDATVVANDVWYMFSTGNTGGTITVNVNTTIGDIVMETFTGTCGSFTGVVPTTSSSSTTTPCIDQVATGLDFGTYATAPNTTYYVRVYGYNSAQSTFTIQATGTPLAIKLRDISATNIGDRNRVDWSTEAEVAGDKFELERSADGRNFTILRTVDAKGEASIYSYWDETPVAGVNHYRLKMLDAAGSFQYSKVVTAKVKGEGSFTVEAYPNPVGNVLTVTVYGTAGTNPTVSISDVTGKVVKVVSVVNNGATIDMSGLAQGMYLVKYTDNNHTQTIKVNKK